jgi:hypothetical protein
VLLRFEQASLSSSSVLPRPQRQARQLPSPAASPLLEQYSRALHSEMSTEARQWWVDSPLHRIGIRQRRTVRWMNSATQEANAEHLSSSAVFSASYELYWQLIGYGLRWSQQYPYGNILPALRTFPLVRDLEDQYESLIQHGTIQDIQQAVSSGVVHPFIRDAKGFTLLHVSYT